VTQAPTRAGYDVVIVGAGLIGLACAWRASLRGLSTLVVDRKHAGAGASHVAAGMLAPVTEANFGEEELLRLNLAANERWRSFADELGAEEVLYRRHGALVVAVDRDDAEELRRLHHFQRSLGLDAEWLVPSECRRLEPSLSPRCAGGIYAPQDHQVDPVSVVRALAARVELSEGDGVAAIGGDGVVLESGRRIAADQVVLAAGSWSGSGIEGVPALPVRPVKGQLLGLRRPRARPLTEHVVRTLRCYLVDRGDGRVVLGGTMEEKGFDTTPTVDALYRLMEAAYEVLPDVSELEFEEARVGLRPATPDSMPLIGRASERDNLVIATGHLRNGVLLTPVTADAVAAILAGEEPSLDMEPFSPGRFEVAVR